MLSSFLGNREMGDRILNGRIEAFSCKRAGEDKKLARSLEQAYVEEMASSASNLGTSPLGPLADASTRRLLIDLISTMNASFPDYDFSSLGAEQFNRELNTGLVISKVNRHLAGLAESYDTPFLDELWKAVEEVICVADCEIYAYMPDMEEDPFSDGNLWSFNYFFFNRNLKRILYFTCIAQSKYSGDGDDRWQYRGEDGMDQDADEPGGGHDGEDGDDMEADLLADLDM